MADSLLLLLVALLALLLLVALAGWWRSSRRAGVASRSRNAGAQRGEAFAEELLTDQGFRILERQVRRQGTFYIDGEAIDFDVRVDLLVERGGEQFVAEVKTGTLAPDPCHPPTRRQLREYAELFPECGLLLVDADMGEVLEVEFG